MSMEEHQKKIVEAIEEAKKFAEENNSKFFIDIDDHRYYYCGNADIAARTFYVVDTYEELLEKKPWSNMKYKYEEGRGLWFSSSDVCS